MSMNPRIRLAPLDGPRHRNDGWPNDSATPTAQEEERRCRLVDEFVREFIRAGLR